MFGEFFFIYVKNTVNLILKLALCVTLLWCCWQIDMASFLTLTDTDLKELGIKTFGARRKLLLAIAGMPVCSWNYYRVAMWWRIGTVWSCASYTWSFSDSLDAISRFECSVCPVDEQEVIRTSTRSQHIWQQWNVARQLIDLWHRFISWRSTLRCCQMYGNIDK